jgi:hypothetical protein
MRAARIIVSLIDLPRSLYAGFLHPGDARKFFEGAKKVAVGRLLDL